jgi:uncharacterized protein (TIGR02270 family)
MNESHCRIHLDDPRPLRPMTKVARHVGTPHLSSQCNLHAWAVTKALRAAMTPTSTQSPGEAQQMDRAIGFRPWEISAMVNDAVLAMHAQEAPFLWGSRDRAVGEAHYTLDALVRLDDRLHAHLEGLQVDAEAGWRQARKALASIDAGVVFMIGALAFRSESVDRVRDAFAAASAWPDGRRPLTSALAWHDDEVSRYWIRQLLKAAAPEHRRLAIDASRLQRGVTPAEAVEAMTDTDAQVRAAGAKAVGECGLTGAVGATRRLLQDHDDNCRFWAAWSLTLLGERDGLQTLRSCCEHSVTAWRSVQLILRALPLEQGRDVIRRLTATQDARKLAIGATGAIGDPQAIPWLLAQMGDPDLARMAAESFSCITGLDIVRDDMAKDAPDDGAGDSSEQDDAVAQIEWIPSSHEDSLPWPDVDKLKHWWHQHKAEFTPGQRHLCGQPVSVNQAVHVLMAGRQRDRASAALELALLRPGTSLFNVHARGRLQRRQMAPWNS